MISAPPVVFPHALLFFDAENCAELIEPDVSQRALAGGPRPDLAKRAALGNYGKREAAALQIE